MLLSGVVGVELEVKIPDMSRRDTHELQRRIQELVMFEVKRKLLVEFVNEVMEGAKQLSDRELVKLGRSVKKGRFKQLKKQGLV